MPKELKDSLIEFIPEDLRDKIATEEDATSIKGDQEVPKGEGPPCP